MIHTLSESSNSATDWKTGDDSDAELQIPLYALYCRTVLGLPFRDDEWLDSK